ncbi:PREDICTED: mucin-5AC [Nicrophorus vespilloides]|uniref:Mucin-5AC n=1 Tax=Nicrophorus vespilloides TaxID=110193 RepID=A0ABM1MEW4_NICVS|nr:PREDICTED: mucin-5AC [Nicrophorus vespilloides]
MPRVRWMVSVPASCVILALLNALFGIDIVNADCWYENEKHEEGVEVRTTEPCLNCTCNRGALLCYLRVCPRLPNPPPPGCILLHRFKSCCPELICSDVPSGNGIEGRMEPDDMDLDQGKINMEDACMVNGSIYGPGSAMDSSTECEYCYCLGGQQRCVKPRCLLPVDGCVPAYESNDCCPVHYNCTKSLFTTTTTTISPEEYETKSGCIVDGNFYQEGAKVFGIGYSICHNCYCLRGFVRCEPLSCAPPLLGCTPVIKKGECCAASYNCSGTIETQPEPNYGHFPIVSQDYAKLRKEAQHRDPYYVIAETSRRPTTRQFFGATQAPVFHKDSDEEKHVFPEIYYVPTKVEKSTSSKPKQFETTIRHKKFTNYKSIKAEMDLLDSRINRRIDNRSEVETTTFEEEATYTTDSPETTTYSNTEETTTGDYETTTDVPTTEITTEEVTTSETSSKLITVLNTTDCIPKVEEITTETTTEDFTTTETIVLESKVKLATVNPKKENDVISNSTKTKDQDLDYDFVPPTLPPSLPNLKIIPFVAEDAVDSKLVQVTSKNVFSQDGFPFNNLFSPPAKTEGGFVPKEPPLLDGFYENNYHSTNIGTNVATTLPVPAITNPPKSNENNCVVDGKEIKHGDVVTPEGSCTICTCYYGSIVYHEPQCPIPRSGCRNSNTIDRSTCCPHQICNDKESPTVVLEVTSKPQDSITVADSILAQDPFRDVIRTEPAPNLQLLIGDMSNFLLKQSTTSAPSTTIPPPTSTASEEPEYFSLSKLWENLFSSEASTTEESPKTTSTTSLNLEIRTANHNNLLETRENLGDNIFRKQNGHDSGVGHLKLAGCNIYGRMYRVGRIISELSGPCQECKCTETGVHCENLKC